MHAHTHARAHMHTHARTHTCTAGSLGAPGTPQGRARQIATHGLCCCCRARPLRRRFRWLPGGPPRPLQHARGWCYAAGRRFPAPARHARQNVQQQRRRRALSTKCPLRQHNDHGPIKLLPSCSLSAWVRAALEDIHWCVNECAPAHTPHMPSRLVLPRQPSALCRRRRRLHRFLRHRCFCPSASLNPHRMPCSCCLHAQGGTVAKWTD